MQATLEMSPLRRISFTIGLFTA
ncbi:hypothetical protein OIU77_006559, partial [Salix suchowensis]